MAILVCKYPLYGHPKRGHSSSLALPSLGLTEGRPVVGIAIDHKAKFLPTVGLVT